MTLRERLWNRWSIGPKGLGAYIKYDKFNKALDEYDAALRKGIRDDLTAKLADKKLTVDQGEVLNIAYRSIRTAEPKGKES